MARFIIRGGRRLSGKFIPGGTKNAALPMLAACTLTDEPVILENLPLIDDVKTMLAILRELGVDAALRDHTVTLRARGLAEGRLPRELCRLVRSSILFAGPLAARLGKAVIHPPGGDVIGRRRLDTHFTGLQALGIDVDCNSHYTFKRRALRGAAIVLDEASVTGTENILMAAVLAQGRSTIYNAACEPHVQDLCNLLNKMGARIAGIGTNLLTIDGVKRLHGARHRILPDLIETGSFIAAAAITGGALAIPDIEPSHTAIIRNTFARLGIAWDVTRGGLRLAPRRTLRVAHDFGSPVPKIEDGPWPAFPSDLMSIMIVVATQAVGTTLLFEKMFESRLYFVDLLISMGANITLCDPHRVVVVGPARLHGTHMASPDIRAGMALLLAALAARGESVIDNAQCIDRGYELIERKLRALGGAIERA